MPSTRAEQRAAKKPVTVPFSIDMLWQGLLVGETPNSRYLPSLKDGYRYRGLFNPAARRLAVTIDEVQVERDIAAEEAARKKRSYRRQVVA